MKKTAVLTISLLLLASLIPISVNAADNYGCINVENTAAYIGEQFTVTISVSQNPGIASMKLTLSYEENALELVNVENGNILDGLIEPEDSAMYSASPYALVWANAKLENNVTKTGTLAVLTFKSKAGAAEGVYPITISYNSSRYDIINCNIKNVRFTVTNGTASISARPDYVVSDDEPDKITVYSDTASKVIASVLDIDGKIIETCYSEFSDECALITFKSNVVKIGLIKLFYLDKNLCPVRACIERRMIQ